MKLKEALDSGLTVSHIVKGTIAQFQCYRDGELWYRIMVDTIDLGDETNKGIEFCFPVPINDTGTGIFDNRMKAITLMRWVRKHLETQKQWKQ